MSTFILLLPLELPWLKRSICEMFLSDNCINAHTTHSRASSLRTSKADIHQQKRVSQVKQNVENIRATYLDGGKAMIYRSLWIVAFD